MDSTQSLITTYTITPVDPGTHQFEIELAFECDHTGLFELKLPAWIPGSYMIREFAQHVIKIAAFGDDVAVGLKKTDKHTWQGQLSTQGESRLIRVRYRVYAFDHSVRAAYLDDQRAFWNATSLCLYVVGREHEPVSVMIKPGGFDMQAWQVATSLPRQFTWLSQGEQLPVLGVEGLQFTAENYDALIDHPVALGKPLYSSFSVGGVQHHVVLSDSQQDELDMNRLIEDLRKVCATAIATFEPEFERPPFHEFWFLVQTVQEGYGGLEHRASTALIASRAVLPHPGMLSPSKSYIEFLGLCSHEYFHAWNVKRIQPLAFQPYRLSEENYTSLLWFFEGFTSYYDDLILVRSRVIQNDTYLKLLAKTMSLVLRQPGRYMQTVAESSWDAWIKYYRPHENSTNTTVSYYAKGALIAFCLDIEIRFHTAQEKSLDDVMRLVWQRHGVSGYGLDQGSLYQAVDEATGLQLASFLHRMVHTVDELPLSSQLARLGLSLQPTAPKEQVALGLSLKTQDGQWLIKSTLADGPAARAGLCVGDVIVAIDGFKMSTTLWEQLGQRKQVGASSDVHIFRAGRLLQRSVCWERAKPSDWSITSLPNAGSTLAAPWEQ